MATDEFVGRVREGLDYLLHNEGQVARLNLMPDIVNGWRGFVGTYTPEKMCQHIRDVAKSNGVDLDDWEAKGKPVMAAEMILYAVDGFYRKSLTHMN